MSRDLQSFLFRSLAINRVTVPEAPETSVSTRQSTIEQFSDEARRQAAGMGRVYELLYCLENSMRELVESTLREALGDQVWWTDGVPELIRRSAEKRQADDQKARWHGPRGVSQLAFVDFPQYADIIEHQWVHFEPLFGDLPWVRYYFTELNQSRRALAHTGHLTEADVERMELRVRDWLRVAG